MTASTSPRWSCLLILYSALASLAGLVMAAWGITEALGRNIPAYLLAGAVDLAWIALVAAQFRGVCLAGRWWTVHALGWALSAGIAVLLWRVAVSQGLEDPLLYLLTPLGISNAWLLLFLVSTQLGKRPVPTARPGQEGAAEPATD
ncbi:hypothetical protein [Streptomyces virginiae]|uniref:hypothetical protein n=1 Tax=Streptomyces virginiae TaxID=1961 RepID=UPI00364D6EB3